MRVINQSEQNVDALKMEVIEEIANQLNDLEVEFDHELIEQDRATFEFLQANPDATFDGRQTDWELAEDDWRRRGEQHGVHVYDDGYAGVTIIGSAEEVTAWSSLA